MNLSDLSALKPQERIAGTLRALYRRCGYAHYRAGRFEEYELYARNKNFLLSDRILTFTDTDGRLRAMKPDVTLSIVKNYAGEPLQKLCYNETVYRPDDGGFREIQQTGLECIGQVDDYAQSEVVCLACRSLAAISPQYLLDISHMGYAAALAALAAGEDEALQRELLRLAGRKNVPAIRALCQEHGVRKIWCDTLCSAATLYAPPEEALCFMRNAACNEQMLSACDELERTIAGVTALYPEARIRVDLSLVNDFHYYNGVIFRGFVDGVPSAVLSGGRYDNLVSRMGVQARAVGFGVYLNLLERFGQNREEYDVDVLLLYGDEAPEVVAQNVRILQQEYESVRAQKTREGLRPRKVAVLEKGVCRFE